MQLDADQHRIEAASDRVPELHDMIGNFHEHHMHIRQGLEHLKHVGVRLITYEARHNNTGMNMNEAHGMELQVLARREALLA